jgi:hypothetical protein
MRFLFFLQLQKNESDITAAASKATTISVPLVVCMNCNAIRNETTVIGNVIAPIISMVDLFFLLVLVSLLLLYSSAIVVLVLQAEMSIIG